MRVVRFCRENLMVWIQVVMLLGIWGYRANGGGGGVLVHKSKIKIV